MPDMPCVNPAEWITASTPSSAADMLRGRARSPMTALAHGMGIDGGWRSSTRSRYPRFGNSRSKYCPMKPVAPVSARSIQASSVGSKLIDLRGRDACAFRPLVRREERCDLYDHERRATTPAVERPASLAEI